MVREKEYCIKYRQLVSAMSSKEHWACFIIYKKGHTSWMSINRLRISSSFSYKSLKTLKLQIQVFTGLFFLRENSTLDNFVLCDYKQLVSLQAVGQLASSVNAWKIRELCSNIFSNPFNIPLSPLFPFHGSEFKE